MVPDKKIAIAYKGADSVREVARRVGLSNAAIRKRLKKLGLATNLGTRNSYTKKFLSPIVRKSKSWAEVCRKVEVSPHGGTQAHIKKRCEEFGIDYSHFLGKRWSKGKLLPYHPRDARKVLRKRSEGSRRSGATLRRALHAIGRLRKCEKCSQGPTWKHKPLQLQVDHKNGNILDDRPSNLRLLCPNCHSQTDNYAGRGTRRGNPIGDGTCFENRRV